MDKAHRQTRAVVALGILLACCACAFALEPSLDVSQYAHTTWKIRDGFTKGIITSLAQTPDGYLWIGTELGLLRFDGVRPVLWQPPSGQHLPGTLITYLLAAHDGTLWIGTFNGLASWKNGKLREVPELAGQSVTSVLETRDRTIWIGVFADSGGALCDIHNGVVNCERESGKFGTGVKALYEDSRGTLWLGLSKGFWRWKPGAPEFFSVPNQPFGIISFAEDKQAQLLFGSQDGIRRLADGRVEPYPSTGSAYRWQITRMLRDHDGGLWAGTSEHGLVHIREQGRTDVFSHPEGLSGDYVTRFLEDREGNIWVATYDGLDCFREYAVSTISTKQGLSNTTSWSVLASKDGGIWIGTSSALNHWKNGQVSLFGRSRGSPKSDGKLNGQPPNALFQDSSGLIWVSTQHGEVGYLQDNRFVPIRGVSGGPVHSIAEAPSGHLWAANQEDGLSELYERRVLQEIPWTGLGRKNWANVIIADPSQRGLWLGLNRGGIAYFADGAIRSAYSAENGLAEGQVTDLRFGSGGALWAATDSGLSRIQGGHVATLTSKNGLPCDKVVATIEDNDHSMWLYMACGLVRVIRSELDAWVVDPKRVVKSECFGTSDGVRGHVAAGGYQPLMTKSADGRIWFVPWDGVSVIDPHHIPVNKILPPIHIEQITADRKTYWQNLSGDASSSHPRLPPLVRDLTIDYTALSFVAPEKVLFRYKLEGMDRDWQDAGNRRQAFYTNLPPRQYRFRVAACNNSGVWNEAGTFLDFSIAPAYYQTTWFRVSCVAVFLVLLWGIYRLRIQQLQHQFAIGLEARVNERTRIARELHDTLLQSFQGLMLRFQTVGEMLPARPLDAKNALEGALDRADEAISEGRDAITDIRATTLASRDLEKSITALMTNLSEELAAGNGRSVTFRVLVEGVPRAVRPTLQDEIYRIARESLRNAFRHAQAGHIETEVTYGESLRLRFRDDGKGIDPSVIERGGRSGHWGLLGIRERAKQIGVELSVWSELGAGTEVELNIPGSIAYEVVPGARFRIFRKRTEQDHEHRS
jgi:signal transduction histidine kinase/ligand-binding sensor domain-containing protein